MKTWHVKGDPDSVVYPDYASANRAAKDKYPNEHWWTRLFCKITVPLKRFIVFAGATYYPAGGMNDYAGQADTLEEATAFAKGLLVAHDWVTVFDTVEGVEVFDEEKD